MGCQLGVALGRLLGWREPKCQANVYCRQVSHVSDLGSLFCKMGLSVSRGHCEWDDRDEVLCNW